MTKVVLDTNVMVSAIVFGGKPRQVLHLVIEGRIELFISEPIIEEIKEILGGRKFRFTNPQLTIIAAELKSISEIVYPKQKISIVKEDPDDDMVIECAVAAGADYIISGDKHLLALKHYAGIAIVSASYFLDNY